MINRLDYTNMLIYSIRSFNSGYSTLDEQAKNMPDCLLAFSGSKNLGCVSITGHLSLKIHLKKEAVVVKSCCYLRI